MHGVKDRAVRAGAHPSMSNNDPRDIFARMERTACCCVCALCSAVIASAMSALVKSDRLLCRLSSDDAPLGVAEQWRERDPIWSPDGKKILFRTARQGAVHVYAVEVES